MNDVCSLELLTNAVANRLTADEETALYDHLERCEACCARMEQLAGGEQWQKEAASLLTTDELDAAVPEPTVWSEVDFSVEHLEPSEDANVLGQLGGYDVLAIIGRGGMGVVLKAFDRELKRLVAIKALSPHLAHSSVARRRFAREAQAAAAVVNPHVIAIHHVQPMGRLPFLIMPLLTGESLAQRLKSRAPLELTEVLRIGMQAAVGLAAAHDQGLVHRDVKPANIFLEKGVERVVITDFGLARAADDVSMTRLGVVAGTPEYMSPEQARGEALDGRSDLFSLGCVLYEMATGVSPFRSDSTIATLRRIVDDKPASIASLAPELPPWFSYIVERLLSKAPAQRFDSASEVSQLLEACLSHLQQPTSVPFPSSLVPHAKVRRSIFSSYKKGILTMLGTLGTALLGMVLWQATDPPDISGQWTSDEWGTVALETKEPGHYEGTFMDSVKGKSGTFQLKWSRLEHRFNGTWGKGNDRNGAISLRLVAKELRGGYTTDEVSQLATGTPLIGDLLWRRRIVDDSADSNLSVVSYGVGDLVRDGDGDPQTSVRVETLIELIKTVVNPDSWGDEQVLISYESLKNNNLVIRQDAEVHVKIQQLLKSLRALQRVEHTNAAVAIKEDETTLKSSETFKFQRAIEERLLVAKIRNAQLRLEREKASENPDAEKLKELRTTLEAAEAEYKQYQTLSENPGSPDATRDALRKIEFDLLTLDTQLEAIADLQQSDEGKQIANALNTIFDPQTPEQESTRVDFEIQPVQQRMRERIKAIVGSDPSITSDSLEAAQRSLEQKLKLLKSQRDAIKGAIVDGEAVGVLLSALPKIKHVRFTGGFFQGVTVHESANETYIETVGNRVIAIVPQNRKFSQNGFDEMKITAERIASTRWRVIIENSETTHDVIFEGHESPNGFLLSRFADGDYESVEYLHLSTLAVQAKIDTNSAVGGLRQQGLAANIQPENKMIETASGRQLGTVLGKPIHEGDINKNTSTRDNLIRLVLQPLTEDYCRKNGLGRVDELNARIKDERSRRMASMFVFQWELQRHLYEKHGGRVEVSAFGNVAFDGMRMWLDERERAGDFEITDPKLKAALNELYKQVQPGTMFAKPDQLATAFDPAHVDRFIETYAKIPAGAHRDPAQKLVGTLFDQPIYLHERYLANKAELPGLLYNLFVPQLEDRYRKQHPEVEPTHAEIDDLVAKTKAGFIQSAIEQRKSLETALQRQRLADPTSTKEVPETQALIEQVDETLKRLEVKDGRSQAAESLRRLKLQKHIYETYRGGRALMGGSQGLVLVDAQQRWLHERERLGEFQVASNEFEMHSFPIGQSNRILDRS